MNTLREFSISRKMIYVAIDYLPYYKRVNFMPICFAYSVPYSYICIFNIGSSPRFMP